MPSSPLFPARNRAFACGCTLLLLSSLAVPALAYDRPVETITHLPLTLVQKPFGLRFSPEELRRQPIWSKRVDGIVLSNVADSPIRIGAKALQDSLRGNRQGEAPLVELDPSATKLPPEFAGRHVIVLGRPEDLALVRLLVEEHRLAVSDASLNGDGFVIKPVRHEGTELLLVTSCVTRGVMYGAFELEERTGSRGVPAIDQAFVPAVRYRSWSFYNFLAEPPDAIGRWRYNLSVHYFDRWPGVLAYPDYPMLGGDRNIAARMEAQRAVHRQLADATKHGADPVLIFNPFTFTAGPSRYGAARTTLAQHWPDMLAKPWGPFRTDLDHPKANIHTLNRFNLCPSSPETRRFVERGVSELVRTFPEIAILGLMFSDEGGELICGCERCGDWTYLDRIVEYSKLIVETARRENPGIRFMPFIHGVNWWIPLAQPAYEGRQADALVDIQRRMGDAFDAMMMLRSTPTGGDLQSWLYPKSTLLGRGVPLFFFFHSYEAGGPGIVAPLSPVLSHLSWPLPVYLDHLQEFLAPGQGMVGGASPVAGMEVAWWHPDLDPRAYLRHWCRAKYGDQAGLEVYEALLDTHRITEAFFLEDKPDASESFTMYRWNPESFLRPYEGDLTALKRLAPDGVTAAEGLALYDFMLPQAKQPEALAALRPGEEAAWRRRFEIAGEVAIAERAAAKLTAALARQPASPDLQKLQRAAVATRSLTRLFRAYHLALLDAILARHSADPAEQQQLAARSGAHLRDAIGHVVDYAGTMLAVTAADRRPTLARFRLDVERLYVGTPLCLVREAVHQFEAEFDDAGLAAHFDAVIAAQAGLVSR